MTGETRPEPYKLPEKISNMTIHHLYGIDKPVESETVAGFFLRHGFGLVADVLMSGAKPEDLEAAVNDGTISVAHWPEKEPITDLLWDGSEITTKRLEELADKAVELCYGQDGSQPMGGDFATVGAEIGSQQLAIVGLIYARHQGRLREIPELGNFAGPKYVKRGSFSEQFLNKMFPEK